MDVLTRERSRLEVLQCSTLVLLPNSITILPYPLPSLGEPSPVLHPGSTHRVTLNIQYADTTFSVIVTLDHPLDFLVTSQNLLPMKYVDHLGFPPKYPSTSLLELVMWLITNMKQHMEDRLQEEKELSSLGTAIKNLINMKFIKLICNF